MNIIEAIRTRKSIRDFTADPVPQHILRKIIEVASRAPSAENSQPWEFTIVAGDILDTIRTANIEKLKSKAPPHPDLPAKGLPLDSVYRRRQIEIAKQLFHLMDIPRGDLKKRDRWMALGFQYFNAPAAIVISMDHSLYYPRPIFDIGSGPVPSRLPVVLETASAAHSKREVEWLERVDGVFRVDVVFVSCNETPEAHTTD